MKAEDIKVCILRIEGTNCEDETYRAFELAGATPERVHLKQLTGQAPREMRRSLEDYDVLALPGGFSAGDYIRAGAIFAARIKSRLGKELRQFVSDERPVIGICNGFQILVELGLLPAFDDVMTESPSAALFTNDSARFECRPTLLRNESRGKCVFTKGAVKKVVMFPSAHAEGHLLSNEERFLERLEENDQIVFRYVDENGELGGYPWNPNGSMGNVAGICNPIGNVLGLMPHPERAVSRYTHPDWTRDGKDEEGDGMAIFRSVVDHLTAAR